MVPQRQPEPPECEGPKMQSAKCRKNGRRHLNRIRRIMPTIAAASAALVATSAANAASGSWSFLGSRSWSVASNWAGGNIANGATFSADFSKLNITSDTIVSLDSSRTIGQLLFGDTTQSNQWTLDNAGNAANILTLDNGGSKPVINITTTNQLSTISAVLAGTNGFNKTGPGRVQLSGANTFTGTVTFTQGDIVVNNSGAFGSAGNAIYIDPGSSNNDRIQ